MYPRNPPYPPLNTTSHPSVGNLARANIFCFYASCAASSLRYYFVLEFDHLLSKEIVRWSVFSNFGCGDTKPAEIGGRDGRKGGSMSILNPRADPGGV